MLKIFCSCNPICHAKYNLDSARSEILRNPESWSREEALLMTEHCTGNSGEIEWQLTMLGESNILRPLHIAAADIHTFGSKIGKLHACFV